MLPRRPINAKDLVAVLRSLSVTLHAGVPLVKSLGMLEAGQSKKGFIRHLRVSVEKGTTLADAMDTSPKTFPAIAVSLVRVGELSGTLQENIESIVRHVRKSTELKRKIKEAMTYPVIVLVAMFGVAMSVGMFVLPQLRPLFETLDVELPWTTRVLMQGSVFFENYGFVFIAGVVAGVFVISMILKMEIVKPVTHRIMLRFPLLRGIQRNNAVAQIAETLSTLLKSGIPLIDAIPVTAGVINNRIYRRGLIRLIPVIQEGNTLSIGLKRRSDLFPAMMMTLIEIGETTGTLADTLTFISEYYEEEVEYSIKKLTTAIGPVMLMIIGVLASVFIMSILTPLYNLTSNVG